MNNRIKLYLIYLIVFFIAFIVLLFITINNINIANNQNTTPVNTTPVNTTPVNTTPVNTTPVNTNNSKINFDYNLEHYIDSPPFQKITNYQDDSYINKIKNCKPSSYDIVGRLDSNSEFDLIYHVDYNIIGLNKNNSSRCIIIKQIKDLDITFSKKLLDDLKSRNLNSETKQRILSVPKNSISNLLAETKDYINICDYNKDILIDRLLNNKLDYLDVIVKNTEQIGYGFSCKLYNQNK